MSGRPSEEVEEARVASLADEIGYGRIMQLCEQLWREKLEPQGHTGGEHSTGCCVVFLVPCPCVPSAELAACDWCCGSGRVTKKVRDAMEDRAELEALREAVRKSYHPQEVCDDCDWRGTHDEITAGGKGNDHCPQCHKDGTMTTHYYSCPWCSMGVQEGHIPDSIVALLYPTECKACDVHTARCGLPDFCCAACPELPL